MDFFYQEQEMDKYNLGPHFGKGGQGDFQILCPSEYLVILPRGSLLLYE